MSYLLDVKDLTCQKGYNKLFAGLSFVVKKGDILLISGINGSGKTSLIRTIAGLSTIKCGSILLLGENKNRANYKKNNIYLGHKNALNPELSTLYNLLFLVNLKKYCSLSRAKYALDKIGLKYYHDELPNNMSAGQQRLILLASLLLLDVPLWLLDEPFNALDKNSINFVEQLILNHAKKDGGCIFTSHQNNDLHNKELELSS